MDGDAGPQVALREGFLYGGRSFYQNQLLTGNGYGSMCGSKQQAAISARLNADIEAPGREECRAIAQNRSQGFEGFSFLTPSGSETGLHTGKSLFEKERTYLARPADYRRDSLNESVACTTEQKRKQSLFNSYAQASASRRENSLEEDPSNLALKLSFANTDDALNGTRNLKRFRPSSPVSQSPLCQVDDCRRDLKHAKDYHKRHKVCDLHSKAPQSLVQNVMQRFCQQCSRFHPLQEFDEGKRSCRRRLAGHNKRRRKTDAGTNGAEAVKGTDLLSIVAILSQLQASKAKESRDVPATECESILQNLRKVAPIPALATALLREASSTGLQNVQTLAALQRSSQGPQAGVLGPLAGLSREALLLVFRNFLTAQVTASQGRMQAQQVPQRHLCNNQNARTSPSQAASSPESALRNNLAYNPAEVTLKQHATRQYLGQSASHSLEEGPDSPPDSTGTRPLEEQNFFPIVSEGCLRNLAPEMGNRRHDLQEEDLNLLPFSHRRVSVLGGDKVSGRQLNDSSESGSDQSPSSSSSNDQEQNGRIIFKLYDPNLFSQVTENDKSELQQWLSLRPGSMDAYLRPGCILLTVFLSMPRSAWDELLANLRGNLKRLVGLSQSDLWKSGRILVQVGHQRALIVNGKVKRIKVSRTMRGPLLRSVRPLAIVAGQQATLTVHGHNLVPQTRIVCVYNGRYVLHEVSVLSMEDTVGRIDQQVQRIQFPGGPLNVLGRCFIEVERDFMGDMLPVIVADKEICSELRSLEEELDSTPSWQEEEIGDSPPNESYVNTRNDAMNFLHELGWVFQSTSQGFFSSANVDGRASVISLSRFKGLLRYAVLRDWCAVVKKLLELLFIGFEETAEVLQALTEVNLLHQAVKRKCRPMIELLLQFVPNRDDSRSLNIFTAVVAGPGGLTPLHIAASMFGAEDIIDALTEDPAEVGLSGWKSARDLTGRTPEWHARNGGNLLYVELIERKLLKKRSASVSITVFDVTRNPMQGSGQCLARSQVVGNHQGARGLELSSLASKTAVSSAQVCRDCRASARLNPFISNRAQSRAYRPLMLMMVAVATICATVALLWKSGPRLEYVPYSLKWETIQYGPA